MLLLNNKQVNYFHFSGGEIQVKLPEIIHEERVNLTWKPRNSNDILLLMLTVNALKEAGILDIDLDVLYLPYARQDRVCAPGEAFSLQVMCKILNDLDVTAIRIFDVHNIDECINLLDSSFIANIEVFELFARYNFLDNFDLNNLILCAPDYGAIPRVNRIVAHSDLHEVVYLTKDRNPQSGNIKSLRFNGETPKFGGYDILVVDDICDGGATFLMVAETLKENGANNLYLYITHGIFSNGLDALSKHFTHIYCHHVLDEEKFKDDKRLTILRRFINESKPAVCY